jgi:hypothetical protein
MEGVQRIHDGQERRFRSEAAADDIKPGLGKEKNVAKKHRPKAPAKHPVNAAPAYPILNLPPGRQRAHSWGR